MDGATDAGRDGEVPLDGDLDGGLGDGDLLALHMAVGEALERDARVVEAKAVGEEGREVS